MKKLILIRHAKSSWEHDVIDHERPLNPRGITDAGLISDALKLKKLNIDLVLISDAERTKLTANIILPKLNIDKDNIRYNHKLYDFSGSDLVNVIKNCDDSVNELMVFGHNHAITAFVNTYGDTYIDNVPTCGTVIIAFQTDTWSEIASGKTIFTLFPRDLK
ncbi:histidine phosphatase family protein [Algibacter sp. 2305UL17-15]|uniref:SixA phosphatase family protein n=1 Tax=Algibacter sp. 2305UL17-15 TaxID=3231268 RepID=UPI00345B17F0